MHRLRRREGGTLTGEAGSDYEHVVLGHAGGRFSAMHFGLRSTEVRSTDSMRV